MSRSHVPLFLKVGVMMFSRRVQVAELDTAVLGAFDAFSERR